MHRSKSYTCFVYRLSITCILHPYTACWRFIEWGMDNCITNFSVNHRQMPLLIMKVFTTTGVFCHLTLIGDCVCRQMPLWCAILCTVRLFCENQTQVRGADHCSIFLDCHWGSNSQGDSPCSTVPALRHDTELSNTNAAAHWLRCCILDVGTCRTTACKSVLVSLLRWIIFANFFGVESSALFEDGARKTNQDLAVPSCHGMATC